MVKKMAKKTFEMAFAITGKTASSFSSAFSSAGSHLDKLGKRSKEVQRSLSQLDSQFAKGKLHQSQYKAATKELTQELNRLERAQKSINGLKNTFANGINTLKSVGSMVALGSAAATAGIAINSLKKTVVFEQQMSRVSSISGAVSGELEKMTTMAKDLGQTTKFTATQAAEGMEYLALAKLEIRSNHERYARNAKLSCGRALDLGLAADITSDTMSAFGMSAEQATHAADVFAYAQANANTNVEQLGEAMKYAAPISNQMEWSIEQTAAAMMKLADNGLKGSIAGQAFSSSVGRLSKPTTEMKKKMNALGISFFDANENMKSLPEVIAELEKGTNGLTMKQKSAALTTIFGAEAYKHWAILLESGSDQLRTMTNELQTADGTAQKMAKTMSDNLAGSFNLLKSSVESAQIKFMSPSLPVLQQATSGLNRIIDNNMNHIEQMGIKTSKKLEQIFAPFIAPTKEELDALALDPRAKDQYEIELAKYMKFNNTAFSDKITESLDIALGEVGNYLDGPGGDKVQDIFTKLGEIAAKTWWSSFTNTVKSAGTNMAEGNFGTGIGLALAATVMGGGVLAKGAWNLGKGGKALIDMRKGKKATQSIDALLQPLSQLQKLLQLIMLPKTRMHQGKVLVN